MGNGDVWMREIVVDYGTVVLISAIITYVLCQQWSRLARYVYRLHLLGFETECADLALPFKKRLFGQLECFSLREENLKSDDSIRLVEIGVKTGENIKFYPNGTKLIGVDWNSKLPEYLKKSDRAWEFSHVTLDKLIIGDGSRLRGIADNSVDAVVSVRSLCSTSSVSNTLEEIRRVLVPGGKYFFFEHSLEKKRTLVQWLQKFLTSIKIWPSLFGDCRLDSDPLDNIKAAGFKKITWEPVDLQGYVSQQFHLVLTRYHVMGTATK